MFVVGLTGGIGCGKSTAGNIFTELGIDVIDTDDIAHQLTQTCGAAIPAIRNLFGEAFITRSGALDREKMRKLVFSDNVSKQKLEKLLHPLILAEVTHRIQQSRLSYVIVIVPLLLETGDYDHLIQRILVIDCDEQLQLVRTMARSQLSAADVKTIMAAQVDRQCRLKKADDIVVNNEDVGYLKTQIIRLHHYYLTLSA
ncbi:dephospho-CoA kinase [Nitrosomonas sp.]|uniref:dephospho-CoA kinase n=1 Tax=Nitrosomonas sp. TaxID=42353 RepID=UPI00284A3B30|nr:dephospho-CoA kinase [Nitrosomonas sp.]MCP5243136.1 dephospho-CoA kinase [Burkholderiales bacterium]MDR4513842.1 dephospho-CoA kinase [Nitrosomonas sp.]